jgi:hypothetical protein
MKKRRRRRRRRRKKKKKKRRARGATAASDSGLDLHTMNVYSCRNGLYGSCIFEYVNLQRQYFPPFALFTFDLSHMLAKYRSGRVSLIFPDTHLF